MQVEVRIDQSSQEQTAGNDFVIQALRRAPRPIPTSQLDILLAGKFGVSESFEDLYRLYPADRRKFSGNPEKFDLASALIEDGRYGTTAGQDVSFLVDSYIQPGCRVTPELRILQDRLKVLLVQKGRVLEGSKQEKEARVSFARIALTDEKIRQLCQVLPIGFMGAVARIDFYKNIKDPKERERMRAFTTKSLLRPYLGDLVYVKPTGDLDFRGVIDLIPEEVFTDEDQLTFNLALHYFQGQALRFFVNEGDGLARLRQEKGNENIEVKKQFLQNILARFEGAFRRPIPPQFKDYVVDEVASALAGEEVITFFPNAPQRLFMDEFCQTRRKLLCGGTGATKTVCAYLGMEALGRERGVIFGPANARDTWPEQAKKHFKDDAQPDVFPVEQRADLDNPRFLTANYVYISSNLLAKAAFKPRKERPGMTEEQKRILSERNHVASQIAAELKEKLTLLLARERGTDGIIIDEAQVFRHKGAQGTKVVCDLIREIQAGYQQKHLLDDRLPIVSLTATPIFSELQDLDIHMALLYPDQYALPDEEKAGRYTFSSSCDYQPEIAFIKLYGERLLMQWSSEDLFGEKVPSLKFEDIQRIAIEMTPSMRVLYDWVEALSDINALNKIYLLKGCLINPAVLKDLNHRHHWYKPTKSRDELGQELVYFYSLYQKWVAEKNPRIATQPLSPDWIACQPNGPQFLLETFFTDKLIFGLESLAQIYPELHLQLLAAPSPKAEYIRRCLTDSILRQNNQWQSRTKFAIISSEQTLGVTRYIDDEHLSEDDLAINAFSLYELVVADWLRGIDRSMVRNVDGRLSFDVRRRIARAFREDPCSHWALILNKESMDTSIDMAPRATLEGIDEVEAILLVEPFDWAGVVQICGRFVRPGVAKPVSFKVLESEDSLDAGLFESVRRKYLLTQLVMAGVKLDPDDAAFFDRTKAAKRIIEIAAGPNQLFIREAIRRLRGCGENELIAALEGLSEGISNYQRWAEFYYAEGNDQFRTVGNNAELVKDVLLKYNPKIILVVGAGTCLLDRKLKQSSFEGKVINVDINPAVMELAKIKHPEIGQIQAERASALSCEDESVDAVECSFVLDMSQLFIDFRYGRFTEIDQIERVKILHELNRVLKVGGKLVITLSENVLDTNCYARFADVLIRHFGFELEGEHNGMTFASDQKPKRRLGWILTLKKTGSVDPIGLDPNDLFFLTDNKIGVSQYLGPRDSKGGVVVISNPFFVANEFEIFNPLTHQTISTKKPQPSASVVDGHDQGSRTESESGAEVSTNGRTDNQHDWEAIRIAAQQALNRNNVDDILTIVWNLKPALGERWSWWRKVVRGIADQIEVRGTAVFASDGLNKYGLAEIIAAIVYLEERFYQEEDLNTKRVLARLNRGINLRLLR